MMEQIKAQAGRMVPQHVKDWLFYRAAAYRRMFLDAKGKPHKDGARVLADLMELCRPFDGTRRCDARGRTDDYATGQAEGMRLVFLHLMRELNLTERDLFTMLRNHETYGDER